MQIISVKLNMVNFFAYFDNCYIITGNKYIYKKLLNVTYRLMVAKKIEMSTYLHAD